MQAVTTKIWQFLFQPSWALCEEVNGKLRSWCICSGFPWPWLKITKMRIYLLYLHNFVWQKDNIFLQYTYMRQDTKSTFILLYIRIIIHISSFLFCRFSISKRSLSLQTVLLLNTVTSGALTVYVLVSLWLSFLTFLFLCSNEFRKIAKKRALSPSLKLKRKVNWPLKTSRYVYYYNYK